MLLKWGSWPPTLRRERYRYDFRRTHWRSCFRASIRRPDGSSVRPIRGGTAGFIEPIEPHEEALFDGRTLLCGWLALAENQCKSVLRRGSDILGHEIQLVQGHQPEPELQLIHPDYAFILLGDYPRQHFRDTDNLAPIERQARGQAAAEGAVSSHETNRPSGLLRGLGLDPL